MPSPASHSSPEAGPTPSAAAYPELRLLYGYLLVAAVCAHLWGAPSLVSVVLAAVAVLAFAVAQIGPVPQGAPPVEAPVLAADEGPQLASGAALSAVASPTTSASLVRHLLTPPAVVAAGCIPAVPRQKWDELEEYLRANSSRSQDDPALSEPDMSCCFGHLPELPSFCVAADDFDRF